MLSKEEFTPIELREHCIKTMQFSNRNSNAYKEHELILSIMDENISMKYKLEHLESDKQKLIEKLEEAIDFTKTSKDSISKAKIEVLENVLKILKGKNQVTVK